MSENPKRKFWQFHLSTAVLVILCAPPLLLYMNLLARPRLWIMEHGNPPEPYLIVHESGYPLLSYRFMDLHFFEPNMSDVATHANMREVPVDDYNQYDNFDRSGGREEWILLGLFLNSTICAILILSAAFLCEFIIRRREARKT